MIILLDLKNNSGLGCIKQILPLGTIIDTPEGRYELDHYEVDMALGENEEDVMDRQDIITAYLKERT